MSIKYILVDFENVQPLNFEILKEHSLKLVVFVGASKKNIPIEMATAVQHFGVNANYQKITGNGPNALDFHIAFYLGELATTEPKAAFYIISRDKGFDPLIAHLRKRKISASRHNDLASIPFLKTSNFETPANKIDKIVENLISRGPSRPKTVKALASTINAHFKKTLNEAEKNAIIEGLKQLKHVVILDQTVSYGPKITRQNNKAVL